MTTTERPVVARICGHEGGDVRLPDGSLTCWTCYAEHVKNARNEVDREEAVRLANPDLFCKVDGCGGAKSARGMCWHHFKEWRDSRRRLLAMGLLR